MDLTLPFPPSVNHYWIRKRRGVTIGPKGHGYRDRVRLEVLAQAWNNYEFKGPVEVCIVAHPPNKRRHDLDNLPKAILDSLEHAGVFKDDSQVARLVIERGALWPGGQVKVTIAEMPQPPDEET